MYSSYTGKKSRSMSTTDVYQLNNRHEDSKNVSLTLKRPIIRRPTTKPPPVPVRRSDSFSVTELTSKVRSYINDDIKRQFDNTNPNNNNNNSPRSSNFVKKLVASLERRQKDNVIIKPSSVVKTFVPSIDFCKKNSTQEIMAIVDKREICFVDKPIVESDIYTPRISRLEELQETDEEEEHDGFDDSSDEYFTDIWPQQQNQTSTNESDRTKTKRTLKNVLSSLINWRIGGKTLPKGSRDYYKTRESLGEEMRAFRQETMPGLMERAAVNSRLPELTKKKTSERPRRETQDFAKMIKRSGKQSKQIESSPKSIATIRPVYGSQLHLARDMMNERSNLGLCREPLRSPKLPRPPHSPHRACEIPRVALSPVSTISTDEHLLRPSKLRDLQKRISQEIDLANIQLRSKTSVTYDVPRSNRPVVVQEYGNVIHYENVGQTLIDDKRLSCNLFTTF